MNKKTPAQLGFRMPAEWAWHEATWLAWPHELDTWPDKIKEVEALYLDMIEMIVHGEKVKVLVSDQKEEDVVSALFRKRKLSTNVSFHRIPVQSVWIRDYSPIFLLNQKGEKGVVKWKFNAWGGKYKNILSDDETGTEIAEQFRVPHFYPPMVLEGGSIDTNGAGLLLTTEQCLLHPNRNPKLKREEIEILLKDFLGVSDVIWLKGGIVGDDTDGHVDDVARFVNSDTIVAAIESDPNDENYHILQHNMDRLKGLSPKINIVPLPMPKKVLEKGERLPASYANFYITNECVLVPTFKDANDQKAIGILKELFPKHKVLGLSSSLLVRGLGAIHCATHEEPLGRDGA